MNRWVYWVSLAFIAVVVGLPLIKVGTDPLLTYRDLFKLGIDLQGGTSLIYELGRKGPEQEAAKATIRAEDARRIISNRIDPEGTRGYVVRAVGANRLEIVLPGRRVRVEFTETQPIDLAAMAERLGAEPSRVQALAGGTALTARLYPTMLLRDIELRIAQAVRDSGVDVGMWRVAGLAGEGGQYSEVRFYVPSGPDKADEIAFWKDLIAQALATQRDVERVKRLVRQAGFLQWRLAASRTRDRDKANFDRILSLREAGKEPDVPRFRWYPMAESWWQRYQQGGAGVLARASDPPGDWIWYVDEAAQTVDLLIDVGDGQDVTGKDLAGARADSQAGDPIVAFSMKPAAQNRFAILTREENRDRSLAIILDNVVQSAPTLRATLSRGGIIEGYRGDPAARDEVVMILNSGQLSASLGDPVFERTVGPELGEDNIRNGLRAIFIGLAVVLVFMAVYYRFAGLVADLALLLNLALVICVLYEINTAWTLPGIAGLILTVGMSVDANILIFERIREERGREGSLGLAVARAYSRAFRTIFDANITTLIPAFVLLLPQISTEEVRGFAVVIVVGIGASMFTALVVTRMIFEWGIKAGWIRELKMMQLFEAPKINWMRFARAAVIVSGIAVLLATVAFYSRGESKYDIEFTGGTQVQLALKMPEDMTLAQKVALVRKKTAEVLGSGAVVQHLQIERSKTEQKLDDFLISVASTGEEASRAANEQQVKDALMGAFEQMWPQTQGVKVQTVASEITAPVIRARLGGGAAGGESSLFIPDEERQFLAKLQIEAQLSAPMRPQEISEAINQFLRTENPELQTIPVRVDGQGTPVDGAYTRFDIWIADDYAGTRVEQPVPEFWQQVVRGAIGEREFVSTTSFEPTLAGETWQRAIVAIIFSLLAIVLYMWFRFAKVGYGIAAVAALIHDVFITLGAVAVTALVARALPENFLLLTDMRINLPMVGAFLTLIGYSLNDTIVVFDRIRENRGKFGELSVEVTNRSINQTLTRTIWTSATTLVVVAVLYIAGGTASSIHGFAFVLTLGVLVGTYSSIAIASPILVLRKYLLRAYTVAYPVLGVMLVLYYVAHARFMTTAWEIVLAVLWLVWLYPATTALAAWGKEKAWSVREKSPAVSAALAYLSLLVPLAFLVLAVLVIFVKGSAVAWAGPMAVAMLLTVPVTFAMGKLALGQQKQ